MSEENRRRLVTRLFWRLRREGASLGVGELLEALIILKSNQAAGDKLKAALRLLWCKSQIESRDFDLMWEEVEDQGPAQALSPIGEPSRIPEVPVATHARPPKQANEAGVRQSESSKAMTPGSVFGTLPVRVPFAPVTAGEAIDLWAFSPVTRRQMVYSWRYLRRPVLDGPPDVLDVSETVDRVAHQGFYLAPVYHRRERNHAHLLLLLDQGGSMTPFHRLTRDLAETARDESTIGSVDVFYFNNVPADDLFLDRHCTEKVAAIGVLDGCTDDTSVLIVSDAGAAPGKLSVERILAATRFVNQVRMRTALLAWLNPVPADRWGGTTASVLAHLVPMYPMNQDGLAHAIDAARGQLGLPGR